MRLPSQVQDPILSQVTPGLKSGHVPRYEGDGDTMKLPSQVQDPIPRLELLFLDVEIVWSNLV